MIDFYGAMTALLLLKFSTFPPFPHSIAVVSPLTLSRTPLVEALTPPMASPSAYTPGQLSQFLTYIQMPSRYHLSNNPPPDLDFLTALTTYTLSTIPYENLSLHYSTTHTILLDPQHLFQKIVGDAGGRGGYCMEGSLFFTQVLRGLGFDVYPVGVRIRPRVDGVPKGPYKGLSDHPPFPPSRLPS